MWGPRRARGKQKERHFYLARRRSEEPAAGLREGKGLLFTLGICFQ